MTINVQYPWISYRTDGTQTIFGFPFELHDPQDLAVYWEDSLVGRGFYQVTGLGLPNGGNVVLSSALPPGDLVLRRGTPENQLTDYIEGDAFPADSHEAGLDRLTVLVQDHTEILSRASLLKVTIGTPWRGLVLPDPIPNTVLGWDAAGRQWTLYPSGITSIPVDPTSGIGWGKNTIVLEPASGESQVSGLLFPTGVLAIAVSVWIEVTCGTSLGLQDIGLGTPTQPDFWGYLGTLTAGSETSAGLFEGYSGQPQRHDGMISLTAYGGQFDGLGRLLVTGHFMVFRPAQVAGFSFHPGGPDDSAPLPFGYATTTQPGLVELGTTQEVLDGIDPLVVVTPQTLQAKWDTIPGAGGSESTSGEWQWDTATTGTPASGDVAVNNANLALVTEVRLTYLSRDGTDLRNLMVKLLSGDGLYLQDRNDATRYARYRFNATGTDNVTFITYPVTFLAQGTAAFVNNQSTLVSFLIQTPMPLATETQAGAVELATPAETTTGTDPTRAVTPAGLAAKLPSGAPLSVTRYAANGTTVESTPSLSTTSDGRVQIGSVVTPPANTTLLQIERDGGTSVLITSAQVSGTINAPGIVVRGGRGPLSAQQPVQAGDLLGFYGFAGRHSSDYTSNNPAVLQGMAEETWSSTATGASLRFATTPPGSTIRSERLRIDGLGNLTTGALAAPTSLQRGLVLASGVRATAAHPADAIEMWVEDQEGLAGQAALHVRGENGAITVLGSGMLSRMAFQNANTSTIAAPLTLTQEQSGKLIFANNTTEMASVVLPAATAGLFFTLINYQASPRGLRVRVPPGAIIQLGAAASTNGGYIQTQTIGDYVQLACVGGTVWVACSPVMGWTAA